MRELCELLENITEEGSIRSIRRFGRTLYSDIQKGSLDRRYCLR